MNILSSVLFDLYVFLLIVLRRGRNSLPLLKKELHSHRNHDDVNKGGHDVMPDGCL